MHPTAPRLALLATALVLALAGCAAPISDEDRAALDTLATIAGPTSGVDVDLIDSTECWLPSDHLIDDPTVNDTTWRVLCRVHWHELDGEKRYQDTTCVGDFAADPMIDHCYRWVYYDMMPAYEDAPGVPAS
ncbi:hypothetical protein BH11ACT5_BH11ACT5_03810 [soil metagenome]